MWTGKFDLNTLRVDGNIFESGKKSCGFKTIRIRVDGAQYMNVLHYDLVTMRNERSVTAMFEAVCGNVQNARCKSDQKIARTDELREQDI